MENTSDNNLVFQVDIDIDKSFATPKKCTCCMGEPNRTYVASTSVYYSRFLQRMKTTASTKFPICEECENHDREIKRNKNYIMLISVAVSVVFFLATASLGDPTLRLFSVLILPAVCFILLSIFIKGKNLSVEHSCRERPVRITNLEPNNSVVTFVFSNRMYAISFASANNKEAFAYSSQNLFKNTGRLIFSSRMWLKLLVTVGINCAFYIFILMNIFPK